MVIFYEVAWSVGIKMGLAKRANSAECFMRGEEFTVVLDMAIYVFYYYCCRWSSLYYSAL